MIKYNWQVLEPDGNLGLTCVAQGITYGQGALQIECEGKVIEVSAKEVDEDLGINFREVVRHGEK